MNTHVSTFACLAATLIATTTLRAKTVEVAFDSALTNGTGWAYNDKVKSNNTGYYTGSQGAAITSPRFDFAVTSIVLHVSTTASCTRNLVVSPVEDGAPVAALARTYADIPKGTNSDVEVAWNAADGVRSFIIESKTGAQNLYFLSAVISGVPAVDQPTDLAVTKSRTTSLRLSWSGPANAASNRVEILSVAPRETGDGPLAEYDFSEFSNTGGNPKDVTDDLTNAIPAFADSSFIYLPARSEGVIQISIDEKKGHLVHSGFDDCSNLSVVVSLKKPNASQGSDFGIAYLKDGITNEVASVALTTDFATNVVSLAQVPPGAPIVFNTRGAETKRRVVIDYLAFVESPGMETNVVASVVAARSPATVGGLAPSTGYLARVTAFDADGNESKPSETVEARTADIDPPTVIRIW